MIATMSVHTNNVEKGAETAAEVGGIAPVAARIRCPHCGRPATARERFFLQTAAGPVQRMKVGCHRGHWLVPHLERGESRWTWP
jgi:hypothetical protein